MNRSGPDRRPLIIVDNNLVDNRGHHLALARTLANQALSDGREVHFHAHKDFAAADLDRRITVHRVFGTSVYQTLAQKRRRADLSQDFERVFDSLADAHGDGGAQVLMHTCDAHVYRAFARWIDTERHRASPGLVWHLCTCYDVRLLPGMAAPAAPVAAQIWKIARAPETGRRIFLWGETERLAEYYQRQFRVGAEPLPLPTPQWISEPASDVQPDPERVTLLYLGAAREEKGFLDLPLLAEAVMADPELSRKVVLRIQCSAPIAGYNPPSAAAVAKLADYPCCSLVHGPLGESDFAREVFSADILWLKYRPRNYFARGSGLAMEAFSAGKYILLSRGTFIDRMDDMGLALRVDTTEDCLAQLRGIVRDLAGRRRAAAAIGQRMMSRYSAAAYLRRLTRRESCASHFRLLAAAGAGPALPIMARPAPDRPDPG